MIEERSLRGRGVRRQAWTRQEAQAAAQASCGFQSLSAPSDRADALRGDVPPA